MRAAAAAQLLIGTSLDAQAIAAAAAKAREEIEPTGNVHCTPAYQSHVAGVLVSRTLKTAAERAQRRLAA